MPPDFGSSNFAAAQVKIIDPATGYAVIPNSDGSLSTKPGGVLPSLPAGATMVQASSANVANASAVAALPAVANKTNYVSGIEVTASGATAGLPVVATLAGLLGGTKNYIFTFPAGVLVPAQPLIVPFDPPLPASAVNTAITLTVPASGAGGTNCTANIRGFVL